VARNNLGLALANLGETDQAVASWQSASGPATAHNNLAAVLLEKGNYPNARKELELALSYNNAYPAALKNLELVSRLDGHPATLAVKPAESRWLRWKIAFRRLFVGPLNNSRTDPVKTASAP
jgi:Flp pilus assembly protein TadD